MKVNPATNRQFAETDRVFKDAVNKAINLHNSGHPAFRNLDISTFKATSRQASKFRAKKGIAYKAFMTKEVK